MTTSTTTTWTKIDKLYTKPGTHKRFVFDTGIAAPGHVIYLDQKGDGYYVSFANYLTNKKLEATTLEQAKKQALGAVDTAIKGMIVGPWNEIAEANKVTEAEYTGFRVHSSRKCIKITVERKGKQIVFDAPYWHFFQHEQLGGAVKSFDAEEQTVTLSDEMLECNEGLPRTMHMVNYFDLEFVEESVIDYFDTYIK